MLKDLYNQGVYIGTPNKSILVMSLDSYNKDIDLVMEQQKDLIVPVKKIKNTDCCERITMELKQEDKTNKQK